MSDHRPQIRVSHTPNGIDIGSDRDVGEIRESPKAPVPSGTTVEKRVTISEISDEEGRVLKVFVRKGANPEQRIISFTRPARVSARDLLNLGIAIDGTQATFSITGNKSGDRWVYYGPFVDTKRAALETVSFAEGGPNSLPEAVAEAESQLLAFLEYSGYTVEFV